MKTSIQALGIAAAVATAGVSMNARAEYRCANPKQLSPAETRACELARQHTSDALVHFVHTTRGIYDLYVNDYVSESDVQRWELARHSTVVAPIATVKGDIKVAPKSN